MLEWMKTIGGGLLAFAVIAVIGLLLACVGCVPDRGIGYVIYDGQKVQTGLCDLDDTLVADRHEGGKCIAPVPDGD